MFLRNLKDLKITETVLLKLGIWIEDEVTVNYSNDIKRIFRYCCFNVYDLTDDYWQYNEAISSFVPIETTITDLKDYGIENIILIKGICEDGAIYKPMYLLINNDDITTIKLIELEYI